MWRRGLVVQAEPNPGHIALAELAQQVPQLTLITQNIDGLHQRAGSPDIIELHGNIMRTKCFDENVVVDSWDDNGEVPPRCPRCGGLLRPDVVWFGEMLPEQALQTAFDAAADCDLFMSIGTSGEVEPAASLPRIAQQSGATLVIINPAVEPAVMPRYYALNGPSGVVLPALLRVAWDDDGR